MCARKTTAVSEKVVLKRAHWCVKLSQAIDILGFKGNADSLDIPRGVERLVIVPSFLCFPNQRSAARV